MEVSCKELHFTEQVHLRTTNWVHRWKSEESLDDEDWFLNQLIELRL